MMLLLAAVAMAGVAGFVVIHPILSRRVALIRDVTAGAILDAEARQRVTLTELKEIEYDYLGGKLDEADYQALRERISREALEAIRAADSVRGAQAASVAVPAGDGGVAHACGHGNPPGSRFCGGCGERLG